MAESSTSPDSLLPAIFDKPRISSLTVGEVAYPIIRQQYQRILKHESGVLQDQDPEHVHQMRVGFRRLRSALQVFAGILRLPKAVSDAKIGRLGRSLGALRDLDVQIQALQDNTLAKELGMASDVLDQVNRALLKDRRQAFKSAQKTLHSKRYVRFKESCGAWLDTPIYQPLATVPLGQILPELLLPLVAQLCIHPAWQLSLADITAETSELIHDLRKRCKQVRYQAEFFADFYEPEFADWVQTLKLFQDRLGQLQDTAVFRDRISKIQPNQLRLLEPWLDRQKVEALSDWEAWQLQYLDVEFRRHLYALILHPQPQELESHGPAPASAEVAAPVERPDAETGERAIGQEAGS